MKVIVDTSVWSLALWRDKQAPPALQLGTDRLNQPPGSLQLRDAIGVFIAVGITDFGFIQDNGF
ncbi:hypothetical protein LCGC14_1438390 [marine sediment metagenome]|uniref:Uncharacterized protein n=1 Tax=marine sediment metagenome TaxID=412755 RepID=A0A0F9JLE6_9ZZZZ